MIAPARRALRAGGGFLSHSLLMVATSTLANAFNYFYHVAVGRWLGPQEYGVFGALFAISYFVGVSSTVLQSSVARFVAELHTSGDSQGLRRFFSAIMARLALVAVGVFLLIAAVSPLIGDFLSVPTGLVVITGVTAMAAVIHSAASGAIQGRRLFRFLGGIHFATYGSKFLLAVLLLWLGWGVGGALWAMALGYVFGVAVAAWPLRHLAVWRWRWDGEPRLRRVVAYSGPAGLAAICFAVPTTVDVFLAKHYLPVAEVGYYTAVSVLGKVLIWGPIGVSLALFPHVLAAESQQRRPGDFLGKAVLLTVLMAGGGAALYWLAPGQVLGAVFGADYVQAAALLRVYGVATFFFSVAVIFIYYNLALDNFRYIYVVAAITAIEVSAYLWLHDSSLQMAQVLLVGSAAMSLLGAGFSLYAGRRRG